MAKRRKRKPTPPVHRGELFGAPYAVRRASYRSMPLKRTWGACYKPSKPDRDWDLIVRTDMSDQTVATIIAHEMLHLANWRATEDWVDRVSIEIGRALIAFGFHR